MIGRCGELEQRIEASEHKVETRFISLEMDQAQFEEWLPDVEKRLDNMSLELARASRLLERGTFTAEASKPGLILSSGSTFGRSPAGFHNADGPDGHCVEHNHREREFGRIPTQPHGPVKGKIPDPHFQRFGVIPDFTRPHEGDRDPEDFKGAMVVFLV